MSRGRFITLEGGEGAGKSTQALHLLAFLKQNGIEAIKTREPGGAPGAEDIRKLWLDAPEGKWDLLTELFLLMAARREHLVKTVWPALEKGIWVISDRFVDSSRAYQGVGLEIGIAKVDELYHQIAGDFWPDLTLILDVPVELGLQRMSDRSGPDDRYQRKNVSFHEILRSAYHQIALKEPRRVKKIDASGRPEAVAALIAGAVSNAFLRGEEKGAQGGENLPADCSSSGAL